MASVATVTMLNRATRSRAAGSRPRSHRPCATTRATRMSATESSATVRRRSHELSSASVQMFEEESAYAPAPSAGVADRERRTMTRVGRLVAIIPTSRRTLPRTTEPPNRSVPSRSASAAGAASSALRAAMRAARPSPRGVRLAEKAGHDLHRYVAQTVAAVHRAQCRDADEPDAVRRAGARRYRPAGHAQRQGRDADAELPAPVEQAAADRIDELGRA